MGRIERQIARAEQHVEEHGLGQEKETSAEGLVRQRALIREVGIIAGLALTMLGIKALKVLPSIPFAPGHKLVILTPLYVAARLLSRTRFGATLTGLAMGTVAFLLGDGRYGIFEILKHVTPGLLCDFIVPAFLVPPARPADPAALPALPALPASRIGALGWSILGGVIAAGRFATIFTVTLAVQAPAVAYAFLVPGMTVHVTFGVLSGYVTHHLVRALLREKEAT